MSVHRYKKATLRMLLLRRLGRDLDEGAALELLDKIWICMGDEDRQITDDWVRGLPEALRAEGPPVEDGWERASGDVECSTCGLTYQDHPVDPRDNFPLHVACDGRRWKL